MIALNQVSKHYAGRAVLREVTLALPSAQTHVLLGASGCGKTTLLRLLAGSLAPDRGEVRIDGSPVVVADPSPLADRLGYVTQEGGLFPHLSAEDNILLPLLARGLARSPQQARLHELLQLVGLDPAILRRYPGQLSGGQRQRVALMRALFGRPRYLLLDEPLGALDPLIRRELQETLKAIFAQLQTTVVMVTHDVAEAAFFGDTITLFHEGTVLQHGTFLDLVHRPQHPYVRAFLKAQRPPPLLHEIQE
jgi:osmoprotectant transport system ATP-binding protein